MVAVFSILAALFHAGATLHQFARAWRDPESAVRGWSALLGCLGVGFHSLALYHGAHRDGINLSPVPALSLLLCAAAGVTLFYSVFRPQAERLLILFQPLAAAALLLGLLRPSAAPLIIQAPDAAFHALLSFAGFALLSMAAAQVAYLLFLHARLKKHRVLGLARMLPSLEAQEKTLFQLLALSAALLGAALLSGLPLTVAPQAPPWPLQNAFLTGTFAVLSALLLGRRLFHWRGAVTARWTLGSLGLLLLAFLGVELLFS